MYCRWPATVSFFLLEAKFAHVTPYGISAICEVIYLNESVSLCSLSVRPLGFFPGCLLGVYSSAACCCIWSHMLNWGVTRFCFGDATPRIELSNGAVVYIYTTITLRPHTLIIEEMFNRNKTYKTRILAGQRRKDNYVNFGPHNINKNAHPRLLEYP
jgi:hypothetical protein